MRGVNSPVGFPNITGQLESMGAKSGWQVFKRRIFWNGSGGIRDKFYARFAGDGFSVSDLNRILGPDATASSARASSVVHYNMLDELAPPTNPLLVQNRTSVHEAIDELNLAFQPQRQSNGSIGIDPGSVRNPLILEHEKKWLAQILGWD